MTARLATPTRRDGDVDDDQGGFGAFYAAEVPAVVALLYALVGSWPVAEDLAQEAFLRAYRDWGRVGRFEQPQTWVRTVAVNLSTSRFRRLGAEARALLRLAGRAQSAPPPPALEDHEHFWSLVRRLPRRQAQAVALRYADDCSVAEIAAVLGCAQGTVKASLHQARRRLAEHLTSNERTLT